MHHNSIAIGAELLHRAEVWRGTLLGESLVDTANALIDGDAIIVDKPRTLWQRIALLWSV